MGGRGHRRHDVLSDHARIRVGRALPGADRRADHRRGREHPRAGAPAVVRRVAGHFVLHFGGGTRQPWKTSVSFAGAGGQVLTIVASTGGHIAEVERFTVTAVRTG